MPAPSPATPPGQAPATPVARQRRRVSIPIPGALPLGVVFSIVLALASFSGGATRNRGGLLEVLNVGFLAYGHGRNIGMVIYWIGLCGLVAAWLLAGRQVIAPQLARPREEGGVRDIRAMILAWGAPLLAAGPLASRDVYSYLMQGAMVRDGFDPYTEGPAVNPGPFLLEVSHDWRNTTTPYGPLHLWIGEGVTRLVGDNVAAGVLVYKAVSVLGFLVIAWAVPRIARSLGGDPALALWLGVANPVVILHLVGGMHNESTMVALVSLSLVAALRSRFHAALLLIGVAVALKATAIFTMPFIVWIMVQRYAPSGASWPRRWWAFILSGALAVVEVLAPVAAITWASGSSWGWLSQISGNSKVVNPLAGPTLAADVLAPLIQAVDTDATYNGVLGALRSISAVAMLLGLVVVWWIARHTARSAVAGSAAAYQVAFIFNSVTLPWYYASIFTLLGTFRPWLGLIKFGAGLSIFIGLSFSGDGNHQMYNWWWDIALVIGAWFAVQWVFERVPATLARAKRPRPAPAE